MHPKKGKVAKNFVEQSLVADRLAPVMEQLAFISYGKMEMDPNLQQIPKDNLMESNKLTDVCITMDYSPDVN